MKYVVDFCLTQKFREKAQKIGNLPYFFSKFRAKESSLSRNIATLIALHRSNTCFLWEFIPDKCLFTTSGFCAPSPFEPFHTCLWMARSLLLLNTMMVPSGTDQSKLLSLQQKTLFPQGLPRIFKSAVGKSLLVSVYLKKFMELWI